MKFCAHVIAWLGVGLFAGCLGDASTPVVPAKDGVYHVRPGEDIQAALESAAKDPVNKIVRVHAGIYRPQTAGQALIWFNQEHDGIVLEAEGEVILTAANEEIAAKSAKSYPAVVNHVLYFGDGVTERTIVRGFRITGANNYVTKVEGSRSIQPDSKLPQLRKALYFYADGGGIKVFGRSYPTILNVEVFDNYVSPCGAGVSIEHRGFNQQSVTIKNCIFRNNRCQVTGSAVDVLPGSSVAISNCLFVGNVSNMGENYIRPDRPYNGKHGSGALTVFADSRVVVDRCTFTGNWNGADDKGTENVYKDSIFWKNTKEGGISPGGRYELDILDGQKVKGNFFQGEINDLRGTIGLSDNTLGAPDPEFDPSYRPRAKEYEGVGYRPDGEN